ncbi:DUF309 domain-containing protein [Merismopedia glauca]|uniref:DUF309 domain-containing protein n=1 Tax=Merismopedia glauca CCAP 1448/3 TaxID=1296344 RepID=A0A2T1C6K1_9CYAN|nr:DUF309 domain-containing protein [Merismopedia glauca]PSB03905.1 DUF309 domain-containing protein [Merismopedia glauca CCAP 1448/3]
MSLDPASDLSQLLQGVAQFNEQEYYACHDTLEALWIEATEPHKKFYQGILQVAVGCYHLGNGNRRGALILLGEGINKLQRYEPDYLGIDVEQLIGESAELLNGLQALTFPEDCPENVKVSAQEDLPLPQITFVSPQN